MEDCKETLQSIAAEKRIGHYERHVLLCTGPDCCTPEVGLQAWDALKGELKARGLSLSTGSNACYRTKVNCLRICTGGPVMGGCPQGDRDFGAAGGRSSQVLSTHRC